MEPKRTYCWAYAPHIEQQMKTIYAVLSEKDRRLYAAVEAQKLPRGGIQYICELLGCDRKTVQRGLRELQTPESLSLRRVRQAGGGRHRKLDTIPNIDEVFLEVMERASASLEKTGKYFLTTLPYSEVARRMKRRDVDVSERVVKQLFQKHRYKKAHPDPV